ncbi:MAG: triose-phosphate isomerase [Spirochaetales bacterium]|nr:triose-phosphate isomerase [Spirochaetales bacterium]
MRTDFIAGNWKMHKTISEAKAFAKELVDACKGQKLRIMIAPPFTALSEVSQVVKGSNIMLGAQNMAQAESGAHTGEISPAMLKDAGVEIVILGHSERRHIYKETDGLINTKLKLALAQGLEVILCVGELIEEREAGKAESVCKTQVTEGLKGVAESDLAKITIAYEPVWAIGTGKTATPEDADDMHKSIRKVLSSLYSETAAQKMIIQYGGSVNPSNVKELMAKENIDGALVGGAALTLDKFLPIVKYKED